MINKAKILYFDIETSPNLSYTWGKYEQDVIAFEQEWYMLSFAFKWGDGKTQAYSLPDFKTYKKDRTNDVELVTKLWELFNEADIVVAHNGDRFDIRKSNSRFLFHKLPPPQTYKTVDTLKVARKHFQLNSNRLNDISELLHIGNKVETGGFSLWLGCMSGDDSSWKKMVKYNKQDVDLLYDVYHRLKSWMTNHPNMNLYQETLYCCPICGSKHVQSRGFSMTRVGKYQRYQCQGCGGWSQGEQVIIDKPVLK
jgi:DNA polymerase elongation subunit (family B)